MKAGGLGNLNPQSAMAAPQKTFLKGHYVGRNPMGLLGRQNIGNDIYQKIQADPNLIHDIVKNVTNANYDVAGAQKQLNTDLETAFNSDEDFREAAKDAASASSPKKIKSKLSKVINDYAKLGVLKQMWGAIGMAKSLKARRKAVSDPFQKAALSFRIKQIDTAILNAKKFLMTLLGLDPTEIYLKSAQQKSGLIWDAVPEGYPLDPIGKLAGDWDFDVNRRLELMDDAGRRLDPRLEARQARIQEVLDNPAKYRNDLLVPSRYVPRKSRMTQAEDWTDPLHTGYIDYEPKALYSNLFGPEYAATKFTKYKDELGKFRNLPKSLLTRYQPYGFDEEDKLIDVKRKSLKESIKQLAFPIIGDAVESLRIEPELLVLLSEFLDSYGRKLIEALVLSYVAVEGGSSKPSLKIGLSHLASLFRSPQGQALVQKYNLGDLESAIAVGLEDVDNWMNEFTPWYDYNTIAPYGAAYEKNLKLPKKRVLQDRIPDHQKMLAYLGTKKPASVYSRYESLNDKARQAMEALDDQTYAIQMGSRTWTTKKKNLDETIDTRRQKLVNQYSISDDEALALINQDPIIKHFLRYNTYLEAVNNGAGVKLYGPGANYAPFKQQGKAILAEYGNLDLSAMKDRKSEHGILRAIWKQQRTNTDLMHVTSASQWFAVVIAAGSSPAAKQRIAQSLGSFMGVTPESIINLMSTNAVSYLRSINRIVLTDGVYANISQWAKEPANIFGANPPEKAEAMLDVVGVIDFAIQIVLLMIIDQLKVSAIEDAIPALYQNAAVMKQVNKFINDKITPTEIVRGAHQLNDSTASSFELLYKASNKEYDMAGRTIIKASNRDPKALEVFGVNLQKIPNVSKMSAVILGLSDIFSQLFAYGDLFPRVIDQVAGKLMNEVSGLNKPILPICQTVAQQLVFLKGTGLNVNMQRYQAIQAPEVTYLQTKQDRLFKKEARRQQNFQRQQFMAANPILQGLNPYQRRTGAQKLTAAELATLKAKGESLMEEFPDVEMNVGPPPSNIIIENPAAEAQALVANIRKAANKKVSKSKKPTRQSSRLNPQAVGVA